MTTGKHGKNTKTPAPHDTLVREYFQHPENALGLLKVGLPPEMLAELKLETLRHKGIHLGTTALLKSVTDLLFTCELQDGSDVFVHILLEHKAHPDALVAVQVLKYMALIWDHYRRKNPGNTRLPFVIPLLFYHGQERWEPKPLTALFPQDSPLLACVPRFALPMCNLHNVPEEHLRADILQNAMLLLMKTLLEDASARRIAQILHIIHTTYANADIRDALELFFNYLGQARPEITLEVVEEELSKLPGETDMGLTFKEQWEALSYKKGVIFGETRGEARGVCAAIFDLLEERFGMVSVPIVTKLRNIQNVDVLRKLFGSALRAESLEIFDAMVDKAMGATRQ